MKLVVVVSALALLVAGGWWYFWGGGRDFIYMKIYDQRREGNLKVGDAVSDVALTALDGSTSVRLSEHLAGKPLVVVLGSFT